MRDQRYQGLYHARLSWPHHLVLISRTKTDEEREFYLRLCIQENISVRELERQISSSVFERVIIGNETISSSLKEIYQSEIKAYASISRGSYLFAYFFKIYFYICDTNRKLITRCR
jgi:predicted nuclease of restriction endonuclease-like (RecB) superfamily